MKIKAYIDNSLENSVNIQNYLELKKLLQFEKLLILCYLEKPSNPLLSDMETFSNSRFYCWYITLNNKVPSNFQKIKPNKWNSS